MKAYIILVGSELLNGMMVDTNSVYIAEQLNKYGIEIAGKLVVGDIIDDIVDAISIADKRSDLIIISGGLGPTIDDLTRDAVAKYYKLSLILDEERLEMIKARYNKLFAGEMPERNIRQVMFPQGSIVFDNLKGAAPHFYINKVVCFPGVPYELQDGLQKFLDYYVEKNSINSLIKIKDILVWGIPESELEKRILGIIENEKDIFVEFLVKDYGIIVRLMYKNLFEDKVIKLKDEIYKKVGDNIFGEDDDRIEKKIVEILQKEWLELSIAESCTGGMICSILTNVPGVSEVFKEGYITYSNESKIRNLNVKEETISKYGAVSIHTVKEMLQGLKSDIGIAVSGIAGPGGGSEEKPVGTVVIGVKIKDNIYVDKHFFNGDRDRIRKRASMTALYSLLTLLKKYLKNNI